MVTQNSVVTKAGSVINEHTTLRLVTKWDTRAVVTHVSFSSPLFFCRLDGWAVEKNSVGDLISCKPSALPQEDKPD